MTSQESYASEWSWLLSSFKKPAVENVADDARRVHGVAIVLSFLLGWTGIDRFYLGKIGTGILKMITLGGLGIWWFIDLLLLIGGKAPKDVLGNELKDADKKCSFTFIFLTLFAAHFGLHYLYLGLKRLMITRLAVFALYLISLFWVNSSIYSYPHETSGFASFLLLVSSLVLILWVIIDVYLAVTRKIATDSVGNPIQREERRYQSVCFLFALFGGLIGLDRFYLGHRVLGILKLVTFGGIFMWFVLDIILAILNAHRDSDGNPLLQE